LVPALTKVNFPLHIISPSDWESLMELISTQVATDKVRPCYYRIRKSRAKPTISVATVKLHRVCTIQPSIGLVSEVHLNNDVQAAATYIAAISSPLTMNDGNTSLLSLHEWHSAAMPWDSK
jgi:hypothetical protein